MGRRRRKVLRVPKKQLPKVFSCPRCGTESIRITIAKDSSRTVVRCGSCGLTDEFDLLPSDQPIDVYCRFTDKFYASQSERV